VLAYTGMRRGELLALRWRDIDLEAGTVAVRRSAGLVRVKGQKGEIIEGATKNKQSGVVDIDAATVVLLKAWKRDRGTLALPLAMDGALVL
jgi:integrase